MHSNSQEVVKEPQLMQKHGSMINLTSKRNPLFKTLESNMTNTSMNVGVALGAL